MVSGIIRRVTAPPRNPADGISALIRSPHWWVLTAACAATAFLAALGSYAIGITGLLITPMLLLPGLGTALVLRWGWSPLVGFAVGDFVGQLAIRGRAWPFIALTVLLHLLVIAVGAVWMRRREVGLGSLAAIVRFAVVALGMSIAGSVAFLLLADAYGDMPANTSMAAMFGWILLGLMGGYLVAGGLVMAWTVDAATLRADMTNWWAIAGFVGTSAFAVAGFGWGIGAAVPLALLGALAVAARGGARWATLTMAIITVADITGSVRGMAPFGGAGDAPQAVNAMFAISLFTLAALMLTGYRASDEGIARPAPVVAMGFAVFMVIAGIASLATNQLAIEHDTPFVNSGLLALGAALGLGILRLARTPVRRTTRSGLILAAVAGAIYVANLAVFLQAVPLIGSAASTALSMTAPLAVVVLAIFVERAFPSRGVIVAVGLIVAGALFYAASMTWNTEGVVLAVASAWIFAASLIFMNRALARSNVTDVALIGAAASAAVALPIGFIVEGPGAFSFSASEVGALALGALGAQLVPQLARSWALAQIGPSPVGAIGVLAPVVTIVLSIIVMSDPADSGEVIGLVLIVGGAVTAALAGTRGRHGTAGATPGVVEDTPGPLQSPQAASTA